MSSTGDEVDGVYFDPFHSPKSRYYRDTGGSLLMKLNRTALTVGPDSNRPVDVNAHLIGYWLEMARKALKRVRKVPLYLLMKCQAEADMNASASDLKSAYVNFTRAVVILDEILPLHKDIEAYFDSYIPIREVIPLLLHVDK